MKKKRMIYLFAVMLTCGTTVVMTSCGGGSAQPEKTAKEVVADTLAEPVKRDTFPADRWMEENKQKEGVIEKDSIQYRVIQEGTGKIQIGRAHV